MVMTRGVTMFVLQATGLQLVTSTAPRSIATSQMLLLRVRSTAFASIGPHRSLETGSAGYHLHRFSGTSQMCCHALDSGGCEKSRCRHRNVRAPKIASSSGIHLVRNKMRARRNAGVSLGIAKHFKQAQQSAASPILPMIITPPAPQVSPPTLSVHSSRRGGSWLLCLACYVVHVNLLPGFAQGLSRAKDE